MVCDKCEQEPCACQRALTVQQSEWINQTCSEPGCDVVIRSRLGHQAPGRPICKWHQAGTAYYAKSASLAGPASGPLSSLDEFGRDLYDAIRLNSARIQCEKNAAMYQKQGLTKKATTETGKAHAFHTELHIILSRDTIAPDDMKRISDMR